MASDIFFYSSLIMQLIRGQRKLYKVSLPSKKNILILSSSTILANSFNSQDIVLYQSLLEL